MSMIEKVLPGSRIAFAPLRCAGPRVMKLIDHKIGRKAARARAGSPFGIVRRARRPWSRGYRAACLCSTTALATSGDAMPVSLEERLFLLVATRKGLFVLHAD